jgi:hypothetical protein
MKSQSLLAAAFCLLPLANHAQTPEPATMTTVPTEPAGITYRYFPRQFVQWVGSELPYSMIELDVDDRGPKPVYDAILTDRASSKRIHYTNQQMELDIDKFAGAEAHLVPMQFDSPPDAGKGSTYLLRFTTETGTPVIWQFVQGSDVSEQGGGLTPVAATVPVLLYREQGAVAGEGTALKVGNITSTADMWKEISQPPYFVAYHGALSTEVHTLMFAPRGVSWKIDPPTAAVATGADWRLTSPEGRVLNAHVDSFANGVATLHDLHPAIGTSVAIEARQTPTGWTLQRLVYAPAGMTKGDHKITLNFAAGDGGASKFDVVAGKKTHLAGGELTTTKDGGESWTLTQPAWAKRAPVVASVTQTRGTASAQAAAQSSTAEATQTH